MTGRLHWSVLGLAAAAGFAAFLALFPRYDAGALEWRTRASRQDVIAAAVGVASGYGIDTAGWDFLVTTQYVRERRLARLERPDNPVLARFPSLHYIVSASRPNSIFRVQLTLTSDLRPLAFRTFGPRRRFGGTPPPGFRKGPRERKGPPRDELPPRDDLLPVDVAGQLRLFAGEDARHYTQTAFAIPTPEGLRSAWEWADPSEPGIVARLQLFVRRGSVHRVEHSLEIAESVISRRAAEYEAAQSLAGAARPLFIALTMFMSFWYFFRSLAHTFVPLKFAFGLLPFFLLPLLIDSLAGPEAERAVISALLSNSTASAVVSTSGLLLALAGGAFVVMIAAGRSILPPEERARWAGLQCIYLRRYFTRPAGLSMLAGIAIGPALASIPLVGAFLAGQSGIAIQSISSPKFLSAANPWAGLLGEASPAVALSTFGFVLPWAARVFRSGALSIFAVAFYGLAAVFLFVSPLPGRTPLSAALCVLALGGMWAAYAATGLLGVWVSSFSSAAAAMSYCFYLNGLHAQALSAAAPAVLLAAAAAAMAVFGERISPSVIHDSFEIHPREVIVNERARLDAEFTVAAEAQQRMLPDAAPAVEGFSLAGSCAPAREVGGDLFDYVLLPGGQVGLCVADVSGKGMQAALYMTLTKGMLASAQPKFLPLPALASRLNRHLLAAGRRKTFVTMSLARLDPATRRLLHVRAGHNPPLLYRRATGACSVLKPRGLGLGLANPAAFDRILEVEELLLEPGDVFVLYSDGLTEMMNPEYEQFGEERLAGAVSANARLGAQAIHDAILDSAREFQANAEQNDDLTLLVVKAELPLT